MSSIFTYLLAYDVFNCYPQIVSLDYLSYIGLSILSNWKFTERSIRTLSALLRGKRVDMGKESPPS